MMIQAVLMLNNFQDQWKNSSQWPQENDAPRAWLVRNDQSNGGRELGWYRWNQFWMATLGKLRCGI